MRGRGGLGGRVATSRAAPQTILHRSAQVTNGPCQVETFDDPASDTASTVQGFDQLWSPVVGFTETVLGGRIFTPPPRLRNFHRQLHVDPILGYVGPSPARLLADTRCEAGCGGDDMRVAMVIGDFPAIGPGTTKFSDIQYDLFARCGDALAVGTDPGFDGTYHAWDDVSGEFNYETGWVLIVSVDQADPYGFLWVYTQDGSERDIDDCLVLPAPLAPGDEVALTVVGEGAAIELTAELNGVTFMSKTYADLVGSQPCGSGYADGTFWPTDPTGRGGCGMQVFSIPAVWVEEDPTTVVGIDRFEVCNA